MANDIKMIWDETFLEGDFQLNKGDLLREEGLTTAILISLFTDARADDDDEIDDKNDKRGWWGDLVSPSPIGSKLWQFERVKTTQTTIEQFKNAILECLQWLIDDEVSEKIDVNVYRSGDDRLNFELKIYQTDGNVTALKFNDLWQLEVK